MIRYIFAIALAFCSLTASADEPLPKELPPDQEAAALKAAETTGLTIYRHDQAASVATDAAFKLRQFKKDKRIKGWITEEKPDQIVVTFIDQTPAALYRVAVSKDGVAGPVTTLETPVALTPYEAGAAAARAAALASKFQPCSENYNSVVLPSPNATENSWVVYLIPGTTKNNVVPIGGTYRVDVSGSNVVSQRGFTRTCIALQTDPRAAGLMITHLLDSIPTEAHVFWSLWAKKPMYVATPPNGTIWVVEDNKIRLVERKAAEG
ncbi:hypothetical protein ACW7GZ_14590 [Luteimonas sp. A537]